MASKIICVFLLLATLVAVGVSVGFPHRKRQQTCIAKNVQHDMALEKFGCFCDHKVMCACCDHLDIPKIKVNDTGCLELVYLPEEIGMSLLFELNAHIWINKTVSARNPPPLCYAVPHFDAADICVDFYDLAFYNKVLSGCIQVQAYLADVKIFHKDIGCYKIPM